MVNMKKRVKGNETNERKGGRKKMGKERKG